jgi:hypothetical protein
MRYDVIKNGFVINVIIWDGISPLNIDCDEILLSGTHNYPVLLPEDPVT